MTCSALIFRGITPVIWSALKDAVRTKAGFDVSSDQGNYKGHGFEAIWDCQLNTLTLTVQVLSTPPFVSCEFVNSQITHAVSNLI